VNADTLAVEQVPAGWNLGLLLGFRQRPDEATGDSTPYEIVLQNEAGERMAQISMTAAVPEAAPDLPPDWPQAMMFGVNIGIVVPAYGTYTFEIREGDEVRWTIRLRVVRPQGQADAPA